MNKEQVQLVASTLRFELGELERAQAIENATHFFVDSPAAGRLLNAVQRGDWQRAASLSSGVIAGNLVDSAILEIESCHVVETLLAEGGAAAMQVIKTSTQPEHASQLGLLLFNPPDNAKDLRERVCNHIRQILGPEHTVPLGRLSALLHAALSFKQIEEEGHICRETPIPEQQIKDMTLKENAVKAYVVESVVSLLLESHSRPLSDLKALCGVADHLNIFGVDSVSDLVRTVIRQALSEDRNATINIMRERDSSTNDLIGQMFAEILTTGKGSRKANKTTYNYLERYESHRTPDLPEIDSVLQLGQVVEAVLNRYTLRIQTKSLFVPIPDQQSQFPTQIIRRLQLVSEVWVVAFDHEGSTLAVGCGDGSVTLYRIEHHPLTIVRDRSMQLSNGVHRITWQRNSKKLLVEDVEGYLVLWETDTGLQVPISPQEAVDPTPITGDGDVCWHPTDPDLFFRVGWDHTVSLRYTNGEDIKWWYTLGEPLQSVTTAAINRLAILTAKRDGAPQHVVVLDNYDSPTSVHYFELPLVDGQFSSLQSSTWDPRTLLLMGPNRAVLLFDITGKRKTVALKGPLQRECIIRPGFAGPMDKFVLSGSEEKSLPEAWVFNRFTGEQVAHLQDHRNIVNSISMHVDDKLSLLATGSDDMDVIIYGTQTNIDEQASLSGNGHITDM